MEKSWRSFPIAAAMNSKLHYEHDGAVKPRR